MDELKNIQFQLEISSFLVDSIQKDIKMKGFTNELEFESDVNWFLMAVEIHNLIVEKLKQLISKDIKN